MTFLEAAIEVLRNAEAAMHFSEVARQAVDENLLSHVGRDPEAAMRSCLNSAVRSGRDGADPVIVREKPGYYGIRPGAQLPDPPPRPAAKPAAETTSDSREVEQDAEATSRPRSARSTKTGRKKTTKKSTKAGSGAGRKKTAKAGRKPARAGDDDTERPRRRRTRSREEAAPAPEPAPEAEEAKPADETPPPQSPAEDIEFEAPMGSGLDGVTDVALVMANAMSRLVDERPELRDELDALQQPESAPEPERETPPAREREPRSLRSVNSRMSSARESSSAGEERGGSRRRRRRRRRGKRVDWSTSGEQRSSGGNVSTKLLDGVAAVLEESGPRSLHVRQIAETLAARGVLGGEISEIERAVTAAVLLDIRERGRTSRFVARGDARYQLQGTRLPERAARAEQSLRDAVQAVDDETHAQLIQWLQSLGARALESLVRIYLQREGYTLLSALPPNRGIGKLIVEDPEGDDEGKTLALVVPRRTALDPKLWEGEVERNGCANLMVFAIAESENGVGDARLVGATELAGWLRGRGLGVQRVSFNAWVLDPTVIESIAGLDT